MKKYLFFAAALLGLVACQNNDPENVAPRKITLHATVENGDAANGPHRIAPVDPTAATVNFTWEAGDKVIINNGTSYTLSATNINGNQADFEGEVAGSLDSYTAHYGYDPNATSQTIEYVAGSFKPCVYGSGANEHFTLDQFFPVLKLQLKGEVTLGKIEYLIGTVKATMTITGGIALNTTTATVIYLPVADVNAAGFSLKFYDNAAEPALIMEKATIFNLADKMGKVVTMPELTVEAAKAGQAKARINGVDVDVNWVQLWADGPRWAEYNIGVTNGKPESYGSYFAWGETETKDRFSFHGADLESMYNGSANWQANMTPLYKHGFMYLTWASTVLSDEVESSVIFKYNTGKHKICTDYLTALAAGTLGFTMRDVVDNKTTLDLVDDAANANWGGKWRMPTNAEYKALIAHCDVEAVVINSIKGYKFTGKETGYTDRSVFFPAAGLARESDGLYRVNEAGMYWTTDLISDADENAISFGFNFGINPSASVFAPSMGFSARFYGKSVRAIYDPSLE